MLEVKIVEVSVTQMGFAIILQPRNKTRVVPIFIGPLETYSISSVLDGQINERPLTHDLMKSIMNSVETSIEKVVINSFRGGTFYARLFLSAPDAGGSSRKVFDIDSRPSDAIALAIRFGAPIFMDETVYEKVSVEIDLLKENKSKSGLSGKNREGQDYPYPDSDRGGSDEVIGNVLNEFEEPPVTSKKMPDEGAKPARRENYKSKEDVLQQMLSVAVKSENYEEAAKIRDELNELKKEV